MNYFFKKSLSEKLLLILFLCVYSLTFFLLWRAIHPASERLAKPLSLCDELDNSQWKSQTSPEDKILSIEKTKSIIFTINHPQANIILQCKIRNAITLQQLFAGKKITFIADSNQQVNIRFILQHENGTGTGWLAASVNKSPKRLHFELDHTGEYKISWLSGTFPYAVFYIDNIPDTSKPFIFSISNILLE